MGFFDKLNKGFSAFKGAFASPTMLPHYARLNDGTHTYNYETERLGFIGLIGIGQGYFKPKENLKWYYENCPFFADCINLYVNLASQVRISEVDEEGVEVENSEIVRFLEQPNPWQDQIAFIKEMVINTLTSGVCVQYGNFFGGESFKKIPTLYNIDFHNLSQPNINDRYAMRRKDIGEIPFIEEIGNGERRKLFFKELSFIYDSIARSDYRGANKENKILNPISRVFAICKSLQIMENTEDSIMYLTGNNVNFIASKKDNNSVLSPLPQDQKIDIETKLSGWGKYGMRTGKSDVVATNQDLQILNIQRDVGKMKMIEMQNNAKENIRSAYNIPRDLLDAFNGTNSGSTYENQQFAEARFVLNHVKNITDTFLYQLEKKMEAYFQKRGTRLIGTYDHMPSVSIFNQKIKNEGVKSKAEALLSLFNAYREAHDLGITNDYDEFSQIMGFNGLLNNNYNE